MELAPRDMTPALALDTGDGIVADGADPTVGEAAVTDRGDPPVIVELSADQLHPGALAAIFAGGTAAVIVRFDDQLRDLWALLIGNAAERLPWEAPLIDIARNHLGSDDITKSLGDVMYFQPGHHGYIARKIEIGRDAEGTAQVVPRSFVQGTDEHVVPEDAMATCRDIADRIMTSLAPAGQHAETFAVAVQRLKYQARPEEFDRLAVMTCNSLARWGRVGFRIDANRAHLPPRLSKKGLSDALAILMLTAPGRRMVRWLCRRFAGEGTEAIAEGARVVERAHLDERFFSGLTGQRETVCTQVYARGKWHDLPVDLGALVVFPGNMAQRAFGLRPTLHRVVYAGAMLANIVDARAGNVTLLLGAA